LEERIAELESTAVRKGNRKVSLTVGGSLNEALLFWDDGFESNVYQGTNDAARSRFRFQGDARINKEWSAGYLLEIGVRSNRLNRTNQNVSHGFTSLPTPPGGTQDAGGLDLRHNTWFIQSTTYGRIWVGLTDQATERITEINLANTNNFLKHYGRWNGSMLLRLPDGRLSTNTWGQILPQSGFTGEGVPGEGDRWNLIKYDSPEFGGFVASAAWGEDDFWDVALRYAGESHGFKYAGGIGYSSWTGEGSLNSRGCSVEGGSVVAPSAAQTTDGSSECTTLGLSGSVIHVETGLFFTGAYGIKRDDNRQAAFSAAAISVGQTPGAVDDSDDFYSLMGGIEQKFGQVGKALGKTTFYGNYEHYNTGAFIGGNSLTATGRPRNLSNVFGVGGTVLGSGAEIDVWGAGVNQNVEAASLDLYLAWQRAEADISGSLNGSSSGPGATTVSTEPIDMIMSGAVIKF
jgi:hypothetical protein